MKNWEIMDLRSALESFTKFILRHLRSPSLCQDIHFVLSMVVTRHFY